MGITKSGKAPVLTVPLLSTDANALPDVGILFPTNY